jgi:uncharacterized membrane protein
MERGGARHPAMLFGMCLAVQMIVAFAPGLGAAPLGAFVGALTLWIPVTLAGTLLGPISGGVLGLLAGVMRVATLSFVYIDPIASPLATPFVQNAALRLSLWSLPIALIPPIAAGIVAGLIARGLRRVFRLRGLSMGIAGGVGGLLGFALTWAGTLAAFGGQLDATVAPVNALLHPLLTRNLPFEALIPALICGLPGAFLARRFMAERR